MTFKKLVQLASRALALCLFIGAVYVTVFVLRSFPGQKPPEMLWMIWSLSFLTGFFTFLDGILTDRDAEHLRARRVKIVLGLLIAVGTAVAVLTVTPTLLVSP